MSEKLIVILTVIGIIICLAIAGILPVFEARTFNRCTGGNANYIDAAFTELRVMNCNKTIN